MPRTLIITPEQDELDPLLGRFSALGHASRPRDVGQLRCFELPTLDAVASLGGHGKAQFALQSQYLIDRLGELDTLLCVGAAGSLCDTLRLGDVVVGTHSVEHDYKFRFVPAPLPCHTSTTALVDTFRGRLAHRAFGFAVHFGAIASGDEDVVDSARAAELRAATGALCVAWEGSGAARAACFNTLAFLELRCITDDADAAAPASFRENCDKVLPNLADLIVAHLSN